MEYCYQLINGNYVLSCDGELIGKPLMEVGIVMIVDYEDPAGNMILKHGDPETVAKNYQKRLKAYSSPDLSFAGNGLIYVQGRFDLDKLNHILNTSAVYLHKFLDSHGIPHSRQDQEKPATEQSKETVLNIIDGELTNKPKANLL